MVSDGRKIEVKNFRKEENLYSDINIENSVSTKFGPKDVIITTGVDSVLVHVPETSLPSGITICNYGVVEGDVFGHISSWNINRRSCLYWKISVVSFVLLRRNQT